MTAGSEALSCEVAIIGLGAMGSAAAHELAERGMSVIGFDRFAPPHAFGSSHGDTRIIREAYFEHPVYVPMVQRAFERWRELEKESRTPLLMQTGGVMIGRPDSVLVEGARHSAELHRLDYTMLSADEIRARFPVLAPEAGMVGVWEPRAGVLRVEACIEAQLAAAHRRGATLRFDEPVQRWTVERATVRIATTRGEYRAGRLIIAAGAWIESLLPGVAVPFRVERQTAHWFEPGGDRHLFAPERCPVHLWQFDEDQFFYGLPDVGAGAKVAFHHGGEITTPDAVRRDISEDEVTAIRAAVRRFLPKAGDRIRASTVCLYTNTPDEHFRIDRLPDSPSVVVASPCSGHGFKFAPVIGEILADLVQGRTSQFDLSLFQWRPD